MELTKIILVSLSIAAASSAPHDYGVKGGAIAKSGSLVASAIGFPIGLTPFKGVGGGSFSSSGSFSESSASSYASSNSGSFNYHGPGGIEGAAPGPAGGFSGSAAGASAGAGAYNGVPGANGVQGQYNQGGIGGGGGTGAVASANSVAFSGSLDGSSGHGPSYSPSLPCSGGNCPSSSGPNSDCQGDSCGVNAPTSKCTSGTCVPGANGVQEQYHQGGIGVNFGTGAVASANNVAFSGSLAGSSGHGPGYSSSLPCSGGNCPSSSGQKPNCQGDSCGVNSPPSKCTSGNCDATPAPSSKIYGQTIEIASQQTPTTLGYIALDEHDRPGKIGTPGYSNKSYPGHNKDTLSPGLGSQSGQTCSSPGCGGPHSAESSPCSSPGCGQYATSGPACSSPSGCGPSAQDGPSISANSNAQAGAGATAVHGAYGSLPHISPDYSRTPIVNPKPGYSPSSSNNKSPYGGSFGGPPGILKPNDYSVTHKPNHFPQYVSPSQGSASSVPHGGALSKPSLHDEPPHLHIPSNTFAPSGPTSSGAYVSPNNEQKPGTGHYSGLPSSSFSGSGSFAGAAASAHAVSYSGGFDGPPGILKPNDFGLHGVKPGSITRPQGDKVSNGTPHQTEIFPIGPNYGKPEYSEKPSGPATSSAADSPYTGGFGGAPGVVRPNGPIGTGTFPSSQTQHKPDSPTSQHVLPGKPGYTCGPGSGSECGAAHIGGQPDNKPFGQNPEYGCGPGTGVTCGGLQSIGQLENKPHTPQYNIPLKPGYSCGTGTGSACGVTQPIGQQGSNIHTPQHDYPDKPTYGCSPGSTCSGAQPIGLPEIKPNTPQHPIISGSGCDPGSGCGEDIPYQGGFGGAPGVIRPTNPAASGSYSSQQHVKPDSSQPQSGHPGGSVPIYSSPSNTEGIYQSGYGISPSSSGLSSGSISGSAAGAFAGASAGASSGSFGVHGGNAGQYNGGSQGGYGSHGGYGGHGGFGASGAYGHGVKGGFVKGGCSGGCGGEGDGSGNDVGSSYGAGGAGGGGISGGGAFGLNLGGALTAAKGLVHSFGGLIGQGLGAAGEAAAAGAHAGAASVGGGGGGFSVGGSFASAQAGSGAKSYGGYN